MHLQFIKGAPDYEDRGRGDDDGGEEQDVKVLTVIKNHGNNFSSHEKVMMMAVLFQIKRVYDIIPSNSGVRGRVPRVLKVPHGILSLPALTLPLDISYRPYLTNINQPGKVLGFVSTCIFTFPHFACQPSAGKS